MDDDKSKTDVRKLRECYNAAKTRAVELSATQNVAFQQKAYSQQGVRVYSALATLLYASISVSKADELERFVGKRAVQLPTGVFDLAEWTPVMDLARRIRRGEEDELTIGARAQHFQEEQLADAVEALRFENQSSLWHIHDSVQCIANETVILRNGVRRELDVFEKELSNLVGAAIPKLMGRIKQLEQKLLFTKSDHKKKFADELQNRQEACIKVENLQRLVIELEKELKIERNQRELMKITTTKEEKTSKEDIKLTTLISEMEAELLQNRNELDDKTILLESLSQELSYIRGELARRVEKDDVLKADKEELILYRAEISHLVQKSMQLEQELSKVLQENELLRAQLAHNGASGNYYQSSHMTIEENEIIEVSSVKDRFEDAADAREGVHGKKIDIKRNLDELATFSMMCSTMADAFVQVI